MRVAVYVAIAICVDVMTVTVQADSNKQWNKKLDNELLAIVKQNDVERNCTLVITLKGAKETDDRLESWINKWKVRCCAIFVYHC